jgi:phosphoglycerate dehydrogenase-like enzyme
VLRDQKEMTNSLFQSKLGRPTGRTLLNSNILIYGYGSIGKQLAPRLKPFGVNIAAIKRTWKDEDYDDDGKVPYIDEYGTENDLKKLLRNRDIIFLCCSQNKENMGLINNTFMTHMKRGAIIINIARGGLLNYSDVHEALESGHLGGLGIDVFHTEPFPISDPLLLHPKVIATPHVAGVTVISYNNMAKMVAENVLRMRAGLTPLGCINLQELGIESPPDEN